MRRGFSSKIISIPRLRETPDQIQKTFFSRDEWRQAYEKPYPYEVLASRLAAKWCLGAAGQAAGWPPLRFDAIEVTHTPAGAPLFSFLDPNLRRFMKLNVRAHHLTLSHTQAWGAASWRSSPTS